MICFFVDRVRERRKKQKSSAASSTNSSISTRDIQEIIERLKHQQHRSSTQKNYYQIWKNFSQFFVNLDFKPSTWEDRVTLFIGYLIKTNKQSSTIKSYISALKSVLRESGIKFEEDIYLLRSLTKACKMVNDKVYVKLPIHKNLLQIILQQINQIHDTQPYLCVMYKALFVSTYFGMLQIGEVTVSNHVIKACDVQIVQNKDKIMFILWSSKTHVENTTPQIVKILGSAEKFYSSGSGMVQKLTHQRESLSDDQRLCEY